MIEIMDVTGKLKIEERVRHFCKLPYPNHPHGCPNYNQTHFCPPQIPMVDEFIDLNRQHWFVICEFDLGFHMRTMKVKHPDWSEKQLANVYYWQNSVRSRLRIETEGFIKDKQDINLVYTLLPEAMGVNVFRTVIPLGLKIKARPKKMVYKIALVGYDAKQISLEEFF